MPVPADASGLIFIRRQDTLVHLSETTQHTFSSSRIAILNPQALQIGNIALAWNPAAGDPIVHRLVVHRSGETIDVLEASQFKILRREDNLEQATLDGILTASLQVPDLRVGDELELAYTVPSNDPTLGATNFGILAIADSPPSGRIRLGLNWVEGQKPDISVPEGLRSYVTEGDRRLDIVANDAPVATAPAFAPPRYFMHRIAEYSDFSTWREVSARFNDLFVEATQIDPTSPVRIEAERIASQHTSAKDGAQAALELVQNQVRYVYVGLNGGNYSPADANTTWERRYGDCKGKTALLLALLAELDVPARAVLVQNAAMDDGMDERLPSPGHFDHVLVQADIEGETYWLDGTLPAVAAMSIEPVHPYRYVLPLADAGSDLVRIPATPHVLPEEMGLFEIDARAGFDEPARIKSVSVRRGLAGLIEYMQYSSVAPNQLEAGLKQSLVGEVWNRIESVSYRYDVDTQASILTIEGTGPVDWEDEGRGSYDLTLPGGGFSPPPRRVRPEEQDQTAPFYTEPGYSCHATTVRLPEGTDLDNWGFNTTYDQMLFGRLYYRMMEKRDDHTIRMVRGSRTEQQEISPAIAEKDNERLSKFDNSKANIVYDPSRTMRGWGRLSPVPATYEIDWTGVDAPCLPEDVLSD
ncbi:DUF3857 domain-containing protein [Erythrobacter litoralis]|nr:DUF3857 domain-containing protein [Erythrobacter litoralis]